MALKITTIQSPLSADAAYWRLDAITRSKRGFWGSLLSREGAAAEGIAFEGTMEYPSFKVMRVITYRNSFLPVVRGVIRSTAEGNSIRLLMTLHPVVAVFMAAWLCGVGAPVAAALANWPRSSVPAVPAGMFVFGIALVAAGFFLEAAKAERLIRECVSAAQSVEADKARAG